MENLTKSGYTSDNLYDKLNEMEIEKILLLRDEFSCSVILPGFANNSRIDIYKYGANQLQMKLTSYIASKKLDEVTIKYPKSWKEAVKQRFAPKWLVTKWPVQYVSHTITAKEYYPKVGIPEHEFFVEIHRLRIEDK